MSKANIVTAYASIGPSAWVPLDTYRTPFSVGASAVITGSPTYNVEYTFDDVQNSAITPTVYSNLTVTGATANSNCAITVPITAIRANVTSGSGSVVLTVIQSGLT